MLDKKIMLAHQDVLDVKTISMQLIIGINTQGLTIMIKRYVEPARCFKFALYKSSEE